MATIAEPAAATSSARRCDGGDPDESQRSEEDRSAGCRVDEARRGLDPLGRKHPREPIGGDPRKKTEPDDRPRAPAQRRDESGRRAVNEEQRDDADDEQDLRPLMQQLDERDRDEPRKHVDDRLSEAVGDEGHARHR